MRRRAREGTKVTDGGSFAQILTSKLDVGFGTITNRGIAAAEGLGMDADPIFVREGDIDAARELVDSTEQAELFLYSGDRHLVAEPSLPSFDPPPPRS